jgi:hypothetical protein
MKVEVWECRHPCNSNMACLSNSMACRSRIRCHTANRYTYHLLILLHALRLSMCDTTLNVICCRLRLNRFYFKVRALVNTLIIICALLNLRTIKFCCCHSFFHDPFLLFLKQAQMPYGYGQPQQQQQQQQYGQQAQQYPSQQVSQFIVPLVVRA